MDLTGLWKGKYTYGEGYPLQMVGKSEPFEINIMDNGGVFKGSCIDDIVKTIPGNESTIEGSFQDAFISFIKKYKHNTIISDPDQNISIDDITFDGIHYTGYLSKSFFSGNPYFKGEWSITSEYKSKSDNKIIVFTGYGTWTMKRH